MTEKALKPIKPIKPFLNYEEQINNLIEQKGMIVNDHKFAVSKLEDISYYNVQHSDNLPVFLNKYHKNDKKSAISFFAQNDKDTGRSMYEVFHQIHIKQQDPQRLCLPYIFLS